MARKVVVVGGRAFDPETGGAIGYRPGETRRGPTAPPSLQEQIQAEQEQRTVKEIRAETVREVTRQQVLEKGLSPAAQRRFFERATAEELIEARVGAKKLEELKKEVGLKKQQEVFVSEIREAKKPEGVLEKVKGFISEQRAEAKVKKDGEMLRQFKQVPLGALAVGVGTAEFAKQAITEPRRTVSETILGIKGVGKRLLTGKGFPEIGRVLRQEPGFALGFVGGEIVASKGLGIIGKVAGKFAKVAGAKISPKFTQLKAGKIVVPSGIKGRKPVQIKVAGAVKTIGEPIPKQLRLAGKQIDAVTAARDLFGRIIKRKIPIKKPLPTPKASPLERGLFADPYGRVRVSRLGIKQRVEAKLVDILAGDVTIKQPRPQIVLFERVKVSKFPKSLRGVVEKLKAGKTLSIKERADLIKFQTTPTGEFKPLGFISREPEVLLSPGEIIRRKKTLGVTLIDSQRVPIISAEIVKATEKTKGLLKKAREGVISADELKILVKRLKKETKLEITSRELLSQPILPLSKITTDVGLLTSQLKVKPSPRVTPSPFVSPTPSLQPSPRPAPVSQFVSPTPSPRPRVTPSPFVSPTPYPRPPKPRPPIPSPRPQPKPRVTPSPFVGPTPRPQPTPTPFIPTEGAPKKIEEIIKKLKKTQAFQLFVKTKGVDLLVAEKLPKGKALQLGAKITRRTLAATFYLKPKGVTRIKDIPFVPSPKVFREYKIRKGLKVFTPLRFIQRRGKRLGAISEVREIQRARKQADFLGLSKSKKKKSKRRNVYFS